MFPRLLSLESWRRARSISSTTVGVSLAVLGALGLTGCLDTTFYPNGVPSDVVAADVQTDLGTLEVDGTVLPDAASPDTVADTAGVEVLDSGPDDLVVADLPETSTEPDAIADAPADAPEQDSALDTGPDVVQPMLPVGHTCTQDEDCVSTLCVTTAKGIKTCTIQCDGDCPDGTRCGIAPISGSTTVHYCLPLPVDLCKPCTEDTDCGGGGVCLNLPSTGEKLCGMPCGADTDGLCPAGFLCQSFLKGLQCAPVLDTCKCSDAILGGNWPCALETPLGKCSGTQQCGGGGWSKCSAALPTAELCDGIDNDCNGATDEIFTSLGTGCGSGICAGGKRICAANKTTYACSTDAKKLKKDLCGNGLDDNCDGQTDENCPPKDTDGDGTPDLKDCGPYLPEVHPGAKELCCKALAEVAIPASIVVTAQSQACDANCDGLVTPCSSADLDKDGSLQPDDCDDNDPTRYPGAPEKCNDGIDQDCDGQDLQCDPSLDADNDGYMLPYDCNDNNNKIFPGAPEVCNFKDDDCDKIVDNGNPGGGAQCGATLGNCKPGTLVCNHPVGAPAAVTCVDAQGGEPETCNYKDDNCDGKTDEDFADLGKPCDSDDADSCALGKYTCSADGLGVTCGEETQYDLQELCKVNGVGNNIDDNCNSQTDEICYGDDPDGDGYATDDCEPNDSAYHPGADEPCCPPAVGTSSNVKQCDKNCDGQITNCAPTDLDFDGKTGEDDCNENDPHVYVGAPERCGDGTDQNCDTVDPNCATDPLYVEQDGDGDGFAANDDCNDSDININPFAKELCNNKDDNCNKIVDEGNPEAQSGACGSVEGICQPGKQVCVHVQFKPLLYKAYVECVPQQGPEPEICNYKDDNCNGKTDEYFPKLGQLCDGPDTDQCANGTYTCAPDGKGPDGKGVVCVNETVQNLAELCDGVDNDCNGQTDEGLNYYGKKLGETCKGQGACGTGVVVCSPELLVAVCSTDGFGTDSQATTEVCDGIDNDCDGSTDEGMLYAGAAIGQKCFGNGLCGKVPGVVECSSDGSKLAICSTMFGGSAYKGKPEVCNGLDDNCDGHIDEGLTVADSSCKQTGLCSVENVQAACKSGKWQCNYSAVIGYQGEKEYLCDNLDNDCDGSTDEDFLVGQACDGPDTDQCKNGTWACTVDHLDKVCGTETITDIVETCNGLDDDCDGQTDEDFAIGQACDGPDSDSCANGTWTCAKDGSDHICVNETKINLVELCNGEDDDCNGLTDETWPKLTEPCDGPDTDFCANGTTVCSGDGKGTICSTETIQDIAEVCDGIDNNCDGVIDEGQFYNGKPLGAVCKGVGACGEGTVVCGPNTKAATCSTNPDAFLIFDGKELCDGLDNDCNGLTDDNLSWKGIAKGQACDAGGICGVGTVECAKDKQVTCSTLANGSQAKAKAEVCDGLDNDCNGQTDDNLGLKDSSCKKLGVCAAGQTKASCDNAAWSCDYSNVANYEVKEISCDGLDNDCNGLTDEGFAVGVACDGPDSDQCKTGTWSCKPDGSDHECINESLTNIAEVCDGQDNDCNGLTDENFTYGLEQLPLGAACDGIGECGAGKVVCSKLTQLATCSTDPDGPSSQAKAEVCDMKDNDCNGKTDDTLLYSGLPVGAPCSGIGECGLGTVVCAALKPVCSVNPDGPASNAKLESCDAKDNDCNGVTDDGLLAKNSSCNQTGVCALAMSGTCVAGKWQCAYAGFGYEAKEVTCDDKDNDCNGIVDDPYPTKGKACDGPDPDQCKNGTNICDGGGKSVICNELPGSGGPTAEVCDGKDNDCNGLTDENWPDLGQACDGPDTDQCANGSWTCAKSGLTVECTNEFITNIVEICNGKDDDCNGITDDGLGLGDACDGPDSDLCKNGVKVCDNNGKVICGTETKQGIIELCNDFDDDCDGVIDNGFEQKNQKCDGPDADTCPTGVYKCAANGTMPCSGDAVCISGTKCTSSGSLMVSDTCACGLQGCNSNQGDKCQSNFCTCGSGAACAAGKACTAGICK